MIYISWSSDFALYLEDYLMYEHHTLGLWVRMTERLTSKLMYVTVTYISWFSDFALYLKDLLIDECHLFQIMRPIFHGLVILFSIFKIIGWMNIIVVIRN